VPANYQSGWAGASMGGLIVGAMAGGQLLEMIGRKHSLAFGSLVTAVGVAMQLASHEWKLFLAGRLISGTVCSISVTPAMA
jgi:MFS family permease